MNLILYVFAAYFLTSLYFESMRLYKPAFYENMKNHPVYRYWTFCYQCTSFWLTIPLIFLSMFTISNFLVVCLAVAGLSYLLSSAFETLVSYTMEG